MKKKSIKENEPGTAASEADADVLAEVFGKADSVAMFGDGEVHLSKVQLMRVLDKVKSLEEAREYFECLATRQQKLKQLVNRTSSRFQRFVNLNEGSKLVYHAAFMEMELGEIHYISNLSDVTVDEMAELLFRNCQMSQVYRDAVVKAYQLCKKAGIDKGDIQKIV